MRVRIPIHIHTKRTMELTRLKRTKYMQERAKRIACCAYRMEIRDRARQEKINCKRSQREILETICVLSWPNVFSSDLRRTCVMCQ